MRTHLASSEPVAKVSGACDPAHKDVDEDVRAGERTRKERDWATREVKGEGAE